MFLSSSVYRFSVATLTLLISGHGIMIARSTEASSSDVATENHGHPSRKMLDGTCSLAPPGLVELDDEAALAWIKSAAEDPSQGLFTESFRCGVEGAYQDRLWFVRSDSVRTFEPDESGDFFIRLTGTFDDGEQIPSEFQTLNPVSSLARQRIRTWFRFKRTSPGDLANDSTLGIERFDFDILGGFVGIQNSTACYIDCLCNSEQTCSPDPEDLCVDAVPPSCTPKLATDQVHFGVLFDLDQPLQVAVFADGSPCGHLLCSPWQGAFIPQCGKSSPFPDCSCDEPDSNCHLDPSAWHLLFIEYDPLTPALLYCLDGVELSTAMASGLISELEDELAQASRPLPARAVANSETLGQDQVLEVDWFVVQGLMAPPIFADSFESGDTCAWSVPTN